MKLDVFNTHMELSPYTDETSIPMLEDLYIIEDAFTLKPTVCGYLIDNSIMYLPRGTPIGLVESYAGVKANYNHKSDESEKMSRQHSSLYDLRDDLQRESVNFLTKEKNPQLTLNLLTGGGKGQPVFTIIPTPVGYKRLGDLEVGDKVFSSDGKPTTVTGVYDRGIEDVYKVTFSDGRTSLCDEDHLWAILDNNSNIEVISTKDLLKTFKGKDYKIPTIKSAVQYKEKHLPLHPVQFGKWMNDALDGGMNTFCNLVMKKLGMLDCKHKYIPDIYKYTTEKDRAEVLIGLSGSFDLKDFTYSSYSKKLIEDIREILLSLGCRVRINKSGNKHFKLYTISSDCITHQDPITISNIERVTKAHCKCISVDAEDKCYITQDFIVTHNTFVSCYSITQLNEKALIVTHSEGIKNQWINTFHKMFDYKPKELINISGGAIMDAIMEDSIEPGDVYFVNHATLRNYLTQYNGYMLHKFFKKLKIGIKVYDESHLEFANILLTDFFSNTKRNWYITATFDRSDKGESKCFKRAFSSAANFGEAESYEIMNKHVLYHIVNINSKASPKDKAKICGYRGMTSASYGKYAFEYDANDTTFRTITMLLDKLKDVEGKTLIYAPLIEACDNIARKLRSITDKSVGAFHSAVCASEKDSILKKDIIVSTIKSMGVGRDIKGLRCIICAEPIASKVAATQLIGRLRPYAKDLDTYFFDIVDVSIPPINWWFKARMKAIEPLAKKIIYLNIDQ